MKTIRKIFWNFVFLFIADVGGALAQAVATIYVARVVASESFGRLSFAQTILTYFTYLTGLGTGFIAARETAKNLSRSREYLQAVVSLRFILSIVSFTLMALISFLIPKSPEQKRIVLIYALSLLPLAFELRWLFVAREKTGYVTLSTLIPRLIYLTTIVLTVSSSKDYMLVPWLHFMFFSMIGSLFIICEFATNGFFFPKIDLRLWKELLVQGIPLAVGAILLFPMRSISIFVLSFVRGDTEVGYFSAAYKIIIFLNLPISSISGALFSVLSRKFSESSADAGRILKHTIRLLLVCGVPIAVGGAVLAKPIFEFLYGPEYEGGVPAMRFLSILVVWMFLTTFSQVGLTAAGKQKHFFYGVLIGVGVSVLLNGLLVYRWGVGGAALATLLAEVFAASYVVSVLVMATKTFPFFETVKILSAAGVMGISLFILPTYHIIIKIFCGAIIYLFSLVLLGVIRKTDVAVFKDIVLSRFSAKQ